MASELCKATVFEPWPLPTPSGSKPKFPGMRPFRTKTLDGVSVLLRPPQVVLGESQVAKADEKHGSLHLAQPQSGVQLAAPQGAQRGEEPRVDRHGRERGGGPRGAEAVSYTHLTLPTNREV